MIRSARRRGSLLATLVLLVLLVLGAGPTGTLPGAAAAAEPTPSSSGRDPVTVEITALSPQVLRPGEDLTVRATLHNDGGTTLESPGATLRLSRFRLGTRAELGRWEDRDSSSAPGDVVASTALDEPLAPGASAPVELVLRADDVGLLTLAGVWGPRGLTVEATDGGKVRGSQRTYLLWQPDAAVPRAEVSVLLPAVGPTTAEELTTEVDSGGRLGRLLAALRADDGIGVALDPALTAAADAAGPQPRTWADDLTAELTGHEVFTLPWSDPDLGAVAHAGQTDLARLATERSRDALPGARADLLWAADDVQVPSGPDQESAALVTTTGARALVLPAGTAVDDPRRVPDALRSSPTAGGTVPVLAPDAVLTGLLTDPGDVLVGEASTAVTVQRALAELAVLAPRDEDAVSPRLLVAPGRDWVPDASRLDALMTALQSAPWVDVTPVSTLLDPADDATAPGADDPEDGTQAGASDGSLPSVDDELAQRRGVVERGSRAVVELPERAVDPRELAADQVGELAAARGRLVTFAKVTTDPGVLLDGVDEETLAPLAVAWRDDPDGRATLVDGALEDLRSRDTGLSVAPISPINVVAAAADMRVSVRNTLDVPATVHVVVSPTKACLHAESIPPVTVEAGAEQSVPVQLQARANCEVRVRVTLVTDDGTPVAEPVEFTARVAPTLENVGTAVIGALLAVGLVLGIVRTVRRGQSARRGARTEAEAPGPTSLPVLGGSAASTATDAAGADGPGASGSGAGGPGAGGVGAGGAGDGAGPGPAPSRPDGPR